MSPLLKGLVTVAAIAAAAGAGVWVGQSGLLKLPLPSAAAMSEMHEEATEPVIYYRDPDGKPFYSLTPRKTDGGADYTAVRASEDVSFETKPMQPEALVSAARAGGKKIKFYRNPMGLPDTSPVPKKDSMGMDYIPVYEGEDNDDGSVKVSPGKLQRTGVATVAVVKRRLTRTIEAPGVVALDERRITVIAPRFDGYVVNVGNVTTGAHVKQGDVLATVFGQAILDQSARLLIEQESGWTRSDEAAASPPGLKGPAGVVGATRRLQNLGVPEEFMDQVKRERRVPDVFAIRSPMDGEIIERDVSDGQGFKAGDVAFKIADHSVVWMMASVAEGDLDAVQPGQPVEVTTRAHPGRTFTGKVSIIYPHLMKETRTAQVRIEMPNPDRALLPDMYGDIEIETGGEAPVLTVPSSAVIDSGSRQVVLIDLGEGRYEPRDVKIGRRGDGMAELLSGVSEGDRVVVNGNFLIDAESNLQSALKGFQTPSTTEARQ
jgi:Cu(I)/Ag(I) efflux system membrane fusion protein